MFLWSDEEYSLDCQLSAIKYIYSIQLFQIKPTHKFEVCAANSKQNTWDPSELDMKCFSGKIVPPIQIMIVLPCYSLVLNSSGEIVL